MPGIGTATLDLMVAVSAGEGVDMLSGDTVLLQLLS